MTQSTVHDASRKIQALFLGGGTGSSAAARGMKQFANCTGVLTTCDDGGSSRDITEGMGHIPLGDLRQFLAALASPSIEDDLNWRFRDPPFNGHPIGSIELAGLLARYGLTKGIEHFLTNHGITQGTAIPMTSKPIQLELHRNGHDVVVGESTLGEFCAGQGFFQPDVTPDLRLSPAEDAWLSNDAARQIANMADIIVIGPGKLFTSIAPVLIIDGMRDVLKTAAQRGVPIVNVVNIMTHAGQTDDMNASRHVEALEELLGEQIFTHVIVNTELPSKRMIAQYAGEDEQPVQLDSDNLDNRHYKVLYDDVLSREFREQNPADLLVRTVLRHDSKVIAELLMGILLESNRARRGAK